MDAQSLIGEFLGSDHGQQALSALSGQGVSDGDARNILAQAATAGHAHVEEQGGLLGVAPGKSFFAVFAAGIVKGDGVFGALADGAEGVLVGRVTQAIADKAGIDPGTAATLAAAVTPYVSSFLKSKLSEGA